MHLNCIKRIRLELNLQHREGQLDVEQKKWLALRGYLIDIEQELNVWQTEQCKVQKSYDFLFSIMGFFFASYCLL